MNSTETKKTEKQKRLLQRFSGLSYLAKKRAIALTIKEKEDAGYLAGVCIKVYKDGCTEMLDHVKFNMDYLESRHWGLNVVSACFDVADKYLDYYDRFDLIDYCKERFKNEVSEAKKLSSEFMSKHQIKENLDNK